jgi:hypothetical protein
MDKEKRQKISREMAKFFADGYARFKSQTTEEEFNNIVTECIDCILALQNNMKPGSSFIRAALLLISMPDEEDTKEEQEQYVLALKAAVVHYLLTVKNVSFSELGLDISMK